jgi:hypothetical protein
MVKSRRKAAFDFEKLIAGGSAPAPWVPFSCLSKRKEPKRRTPGRFAAHTYVRCPDRTQGAPAWRARSAAGSHRTSRLLRLTLAAALNNAPRARSGVSRILPALFGARLAPTGWERSSRTFTPRCFQSPWRARASASLGPAPRGARGSGDRRARARSAGGCCAIRGAFLLVAFLWASKKSDLPVSHPQVKHAQAAQLNQRGNLHAGLPVLGIFVTHASASLYEATCDIATVSVIPQRA